MDGVAETCQTRRIRKTVPQPIDDPIYHHATEDGLHKTLEQFKDQIYNKPSEQRSARSDLESKEENMSDTRYAKKRKRIPIEDDDVASIKAVSPESLKLSFFRKYKKSFETMTRSDMEEMIALKIAESFFHKTELTELSTKCDEQKLLISSLRTKMDELTKLFLDLEMLHARVIKDMELKNNNIVAPVKITRAVGLQVRLSRKFNSSMHFSLNDRDGAVNQAIETTPTSKTQSEPCHIAKKRSSNTYPILKESNGGAIPQAPQQTLQLTPNIQNQQQPTAPVIDLTDEGNLINSSSNTANSSPLLVPIAGKSNANFVNNNKIKFDTLNHALNTNCIQLGSPTRIAVMKIGMQYAPVPENNLQQKPNLQTALLQRFHPPPLPNHTNEAGCPNWKKIPPPPNIRIATVESGCINISWTMNDMTEDHAAITRYQIYSAAPSTNTWRHNGDVEAMLLPMVVTLGPFSEGQLYHFAIRAVDEHARYGLFSIASKCS